MSLLNVNSRPHCMMGVEMEQGALIQGRKLRRVASPRKSSTCLLLSSSFSSSSSPPLPSPASAGLDNLLRDPPNKYPRRAVTPSPSRCDLTTRQKPLDPKFTNPPPSPTRIHKPPYPAQIPSDLIPQTSTAEQSSSIEKHCEEARLTPFDLPGLLEQIIYYLDELNTVPFEPPPVRRKPLSYQHAVLIYYPDSARAKEAWAAACRPSDNDNNAEAHHSGVYACLLVNREWNDAAKRVLRRKAFFTDYEMWRRFAYRREGHTPHLKTFVLHKVGQAQDEELRLLGQQPRLEWLELHVCSDLSPAEQLLCSPYLKRIAFPGCSRVDDSILELIAKNCPNLEILDLRACEMVTDKGLIAIAEGCPKLKYLNVGRVKGGERITCEAVDAIARLTEVNTLGLAGCEVSDRGIWSVAIHRGPKIERLSLNNCLHLSNASIPLILPSTPNLQVLELRGCMRITHVRPIVEFRRKWWSRGVLIEGCEVFEGRMRREEEELEKEERNKHVEHGGAEPMIVDE